MSEIKKFNLTIVLPLFVVISAVALYMLFGGSTSKLPSLGEAPDFELTDINDNLVRFQELDGKVRMVYFLFASCTDVCPITTHQMVQIQDKLKEKNLFGKDLQFISITVDTERDTPSVLKEYGDRFGVDWDGWSFLRGENDQQIEQIALGYKAGVYNLGDGEFIHSDRLFLVDRSGEIRKMDGEHNIDELVKDIQSLLKEKS